VTLVPARLQPGDPRPDAFDPAGGGLDLARLSGSIPAPDAAVLARERSTFRQLAAAMPAPVMEVCVAWIVTFAAALLADYTSLCHHTGLMYQASYSAPHFDRARACSVHPSVPRTAQEGRHVISAVVLLTVSDLCLVK